MGRKCTVCIHKEREAIDKALLDYRAPLESIAGQYQLSESALVRHKNSHLPQIMSKAILDRKEKGQELFLPAEVVPPTIQQVEQAEENHAQELQDTQSQLTEREIGLGGSLLDRLADLQQQTKEILAQARGALKLKTALSAIGRAEDLLELEAKLTKQLADTPVFKQYVVYLPQQMSEEQWQQQAAKQTQLKQ